MQKILAVIICFIVFIIFVVSNIHAQTCDKPPSPTSLSPSGTITSDINQISWSQVPGISKYLLRVHDTTLDANPNDHWRCPVDPAVNPGDVCADVSALSYSYIFKPNHVYNIWIHALNSCNVYSDATVNTNVIVAPVPLPTPIPTRVPVNPSYLYVSPSGNDTNSGSIDQPLKTLGKAKEKVRLINGSMNGDIVVYLRGGVYSLTAPLSFEVSDSGSNGYFVYYKNYQSEIPVISGGKRVNGWVQDGTIWKTQLSSGQTIRQFYVNGKRKIRARNNGGLPGGVKTSSGFTTTDLSMQNWQNKDALEFISNSDWKQYRCHVSTITGNVITIQEPCWSNAQYQVGAAMDSVSWIENARELLDSQGEWYYDKSTGWLYYMPEIGQTTQTIEAVIPLQETLLTLSGSIGSSVHNIAFEGLIFTYSTWNFPSDTSGFVPVQSHLIMVGPLGSVWNTPPGNPPGNWQKMPAAVHVSYGEKISFVRNQFLHLGSTALEVNNGSKEVSVAGNHFTDVSGPGISMGDVDKPKTAIDGEITRNNSIFSNYIHDVGMEYASSVGVWLGHVQKTLISHNELFDLPYSGISIGWGWGVNDPTVSKDNVIESNSIHDHLKTLVDGGGIYSLSAQPGNIYTHNIIQNQQNVIPQLDWNAGIYLDDGSGYITVSDNVIFNCQAHTAFFKGGDHVITGNYWQDRFTNDIYFAPGPWNFGPNTINNNHTISSLSDASQSIISSAGLDASFNDIKNLRIFHLPTLLIADITGDSTVNIFDYNILVTNFGVIGTPGWHISDLNPDGKIDIFDYNILVSNFGATSQ